MMYILDGVIEISNRGRQTNLAVVKKKSQR